jgi:hypothetical protein
MEAVGAERRLDQIARDAETKQHGAAGQVVVEQHPLAPARADEVAADVVAGGQDGPKLFAARQDHVAKRGKDRGG